MNPLFALRSHWPVLRSLKGSDDAVDIMQMSPLFRRAISGGDRRSGWSTFYTKVSDLEAAVALAESLGSTIRLPITDLPDTRIAVVSDPDGNAVGLCADHSGASRTGPACVLPACVLKDV
jgi:hypothetical protein